MSKITKIKLQKNKKRVNVYLDGKFAFGLDLDNFAKAGLKVGQELSEKEINDLIFKNEFQKLYDRCLRLIAARPRSEKEIKDYLFKKLPKKHPILVSARESLIKETVNKLKKRNFLDDQVFATWWVEQRATFRPRGKLALKIELRQKGISAEIAEEIIEKMVDESALAKKAAQKKLKSLKKLAPKEFREKMAAFLSRQGFSWEIIKATLEDLAKLE